MNDDSREQIIRLRNKGWTFPQIAEELDLHPEAARSAYRRYEVSSEQRADGEDPDDKQPEEQQAPQFKEIKNGLAAEASSYNGTITSLEKLLEACDYYTNGYDKLWRIKNHVVNVWGNNWQVKAWFEPRAEYPVESAVNDLIDKLKRHAPNYNPPKSIGVGGEYLFVPSLYDAHFNKLSADGSYTLKVAVDTFKSAGETMIARALSLQMPIKRVLFVIGQDALHTDNLKSTTTYGTWVESADAQRKSIDAVCEAVIHVTEQLATVAPVDVVTVEGNHDRYSTYWLGKVVSAWFKNHPYVKVDELYQGGNAAPRKYYQFGNVLLGLDHGNSVKPEQLALTMAYEAKEQWANTTYREFLRGHFHKRTELFHRVIDEKGVNIRVLPALCPPDEWHLMKGFVGSQRAADALFYHYEHGPAGTFPVFIDELGIK